MTRVTRVSAASSDLDLLRAHRGGAAGAFAQLVTRHLDMVYSAALRQVRDPHLADDVTQAVFLVLWQKAAALDEQTILPAWLYKVAGYCAANALRLRTIRTRHERRAAQMAGSDEMDRNHSSTAAVAATEDAELCALLDRAVAKLSPTDRTAVIMRFFENKSAEDVAAVLQVTPEAARKRVERAVAKLQGVLSRLGVTTAVPALTGFLLRRAIVSAPPQVAASVNAAIVAAASTGSAASATGGAAAIIAKGALVTMTAKSQWLAVAAAILLLLVGVAVTYSYMTSPRTRTTRTQTTGAQPPSSTARATAAAPIVPPNTLRVQAFIDGRSRLCISGNTAHWSNLEYNAPGAINNRNRPTVFNGQNWYPTWSQLPLSRLSVSDEYKPITPPLPRAPVTVRVTPIDARGTVRIVQQPVEANQYTLIVEFDDSLPGGAANYTVDLSFTSAATATATQPLPAAAAIASHDRKR